MNLDQIIRHADTTVADRKYLPLPEVFIDTGPLDSVLLHTWWLYAATCLSAVVYDPPDKPIFRHLDDLLLSPVFQNWISGRIPPNLTAPTLPS